MTEYKCDGCGEIIEISCENPEWMRCRCVREKEREEL